MSELYLISKPSGYPFSLPAIHGEGGDAAGGGMVGILDDLLNGMVALLNSGGSFEWLPGIQALSTNLHPLIVHFPIAFITAFFFLELVGLLWTRYQSLRQVASWMLYLGAFGAISAAATGLIAEDTVPHGESVHSIMEWHGRLGLTVASLTIVLAVWRILVKANFSLMANSLHLTLAAVAAIALFFGADLGGLMVYEHGVGVKHLQVPDEHHHHNAQPEPGDRPDPS